MAVPELFERDLAERLHAVDRSDSAHRGGTLGVDLDRVLTAGRRRVVRRRAGVGAALVAGVASVAVGAAVFGGVGRSQAYPAVPGPSVPNSHSVTTESLLGGCVGNLTPVADRVFLCQPGTAGGVPFTVDERGTRLPILSGAGLPRGMSLFALDPAAGGRRVLVATAPASATQVHLIGTTAPAHPIDVARAGTGPWVASTTVPATYDLAHVDLWWRDAQGRLTSLRHGRADVAHLGAPGYRARFEVMPDGAFTVHGGRFDYSWEDPRRLAPRILAGDAASADRFAVIVVPGRAADLTVPIPATVRVTSALETAYLAHGDVTVAYLAYEPAEGSDVVPTLATWTDVSGVDWVMPFDGEPMRRR